MWHFGPPRSKFGKWLDKRGISQAEVSKRSGVPDATISALATGKTQKPSRLVGRKLMQALKSLDAGVDIRDFWDV